MANPKKQRGVKFTRETIKALGRMTKEQRWNFLALLVRRMKRIKEQQRASSSFQK